MTEYDEEPDVCGDENCTEKRHPYICLMQRQENDDILSRTWWLANREQADSFAEFLKSNLGPPLFEGIQSAESAASVADSIGDGLILIEPERDETA